MKRPWVKKRLHTTIIIVIAIVIVKVSRYTVHVQNWLFTSCFSSNSFSLIWNDASILLNTEGGLLSSGSSEMTLRSIHIQCS